LLVVEDAEDARDLLSEVLLGQGAEVTAMPDARGAVGWLRQNRPDVIISDLEMPEQDGLEMMRTIRSRTAEPGGFVPAIALTAYAAPEDRNRSLASGFQVHLAKPVNLTELLFTIASLAQRTSRRREPSVH
jgi:CheY-like chemotaxis protein